jgi:hypothetical protein
VILVTGISGRSGISVIREFERHGLRLVQVQPMKSGTVSLTYSTL